MSTKTKKAAVEAIYPLSPMQQGMLFHSLYNPSSGLYLEQNRYSLRGHLDAAVFKQCWEDIIRRHAALRTQFMWQDLDAPLQAIWQEVKLPWAEDDLRGLSEDEQQARIATLLQDDRQRCSRLDRAPLFHLTLLRLQDDFYQFIWSFHHILLDGWSVAIILQEFFSTYEARRQERTIDLLPPPSYRDYSAWLKRQDRTEAEQFWRQKLENFTSPTTLQIGRTHIGKSALGVDMDVHSIQRMLAPAMTTTLQDFCRQYKITLNTLIQGCWALFLSTYSGENDVVFGMVVAGRPLELPRAEDMVGLFINTLPVRAFVDAKQPVSDWLQEIQMQQVKARQYDYCTLTDIQRWSDLPGNVSLFDSIIVFENYPADEELVNQFSLEIDSLHESSSTNYPLCLGIMPGKEMLVYLAYDHQRFDAKTMQSLLDHFQLLLEQISHSDSRMLIGDLPLLTAAECEEIVSDWNDTSVSFPTVHSFSEQFEKWVRDCPDRCAMVYDNTYLSYAELDRRVNFLARTLQSRGVKREERVGLCCERSLEMFIAVLAILRAGGVYVPLDPAYPDERLAYICQDAQLTLLLTQGDHGAALAQGVAESLCLDDCWSQLNVQQWSEMPEASVGSLDNLAYMIYTSGSTGKPKGVMLSHKGLCNLAQAGQAVFGVEQSKRILQFSSMSFDASIWEMSAAFATGSTLVLPTREEILPGQALQQLLLEQAVTMATLTPSVLVTIAEGDLPMLETVIAAGEACSRELVEHWGIGRKFFNAYGPTETTVCASADECRVDKDERPTIGRPLANMDLYVLNERMQPLPIGVTGELYVGGAGLARGYVRRPDLTAERFVPHPFSREPGARLYKTGDIVKYRADGRIEYVGRADYQVKLRGLRIELHEIEQILAQHIAVQQCVVMMREDVQGEHSLIAYVIAQDEQYIDSLELRKYLESKLPAYMLPRAIVQLDEFPITTNGKIDRKRLPAPEADALIHSKEFQAPRDTVERMLVQCIEEILHLHSVGITDNFFLLGGHSLSAIRLMNEIHKRLSITIDLPVLFQAEHIAALARVIRQAQGAQDVEQSPLVMIQPHGELAPFFCVHPASGNVSCYYQLAKYLRTDRPLYGIQDISKVEEGSRIPSMEEIASTYIAALREIQPHGPYFLSGYSFGGIVAFEMAQQLLAQGQEVALLAIFDSHPPTHAQDETDDETTLLAIIASEWLREKNDKKVQEIYDELASLNTEAQLQRVLAWVREAKIETLFYGCGLA